MIRKVLFLVMSMLLLSVGTARAALATLTVYDGTATNQYVPIYGYYCDDYLKCEFIIPAADLASMTDCEISALKWYLSTPASDSWGDASFQIFVKEVDATTISDYYGPDDATIIYEGAIDGTQDEIDIAFASPYTYHGGNLLIGVYNVVEGTWKSCYFYGVAASGACISGTGTSLDAVSKTQRDFLPKTTFTFNAPEGYVAAPTSFIASDITGTSAT
ncbi:MAG: hypothetical protein II519_00240, partial [Muribaculaceae bacterium]|nr:hypothetical protein [Muribaculaceae bacterium]